MSAIDASANELALLSAAVYLATAVIEGNEEKIDDGVVMLRLGWDTRIFDGSHLLSVSSKILEAADQEIAIRKMLDGMAARKQEHRH